MAEPDTIGAGDVLIVGAGLAGLFTALKIARERPVTVLATAPLNQGASSAWAQGGVAAALGDWDSAASHAEDTNIAGAGINDRAIVRLLTQSASRRIEDLLAIGVPFDTDEEGNLVMGRESAHSERRIVKVKGDRAGREIMTALVEEVGRNRDITVIENMTATELVTHDGHVAGVFAAPTGRDTQVFVKARAVVLATGGLGHLFQITTNPMPIRGEGLGMAALAGATIADPEFVQFHPTSMDVGKDPAPLATEALRGEGATLHNSKGERFMLALHEDAELAPRDVVTRGIFAQIQAGERVFLDTRKAVGPSITERFPTVYGYCQDVGIDPVAEAIPVTPAQHYHMGGILTDANGRSTLPGLWAVGEVTSTGAHGANRLASNSLLEAIVFGHRAAEDILQADLAPAVGFTPKPSLKMNRAAVRRCLPALRQIMTRYAGVLRSGEGLRAAIREIAVLEAETDYAAPFVNIATAAKLIATAALLRTESRGGHFRTDYPDANQAQAERTIFDIRQMRAVEETVLDAHAEEATGT